MDLSWKKKVMERVLDYVADRGGVIDIAECAKDLRLSKAEVAEAIEELRREGWVEKEAEGDSLISTCLKSFAYDYESKTLELEFRTGGIYQYFGVPAKIHKALANAPSPGRFFHRNIRGAYPFKRASVGQRIFPPKRRRKVVGHLNCPYCERAVAIEEGKRYYLCPSCQRRLEFVGAWSEI
jgi:hypothetical protein